MNKTSICSLQAEELTLCANKFFESMTAKGWKNSYGYYINDWRAEARSYLCSWQSNLRNKATTTNRRRKDCNDPSDYNF